MAWSIAAAVAPSGSASYLTILVPASSSLTLQTRRPLRSVSSKRPALQLSLFFNGESFLRDFLPFADSRPPARGSTGLPALHVVNSQRNHLNSGSNSETKVLRSSTPSWDGTKALAVTEGFCIVVAAASYTISMFQKQQASLVGSSSAGESKLVSKTGDLSTWYVPALWAALVINAIFRTMQRKSSTKPTMVWEERSIKNFTLDQRVGKLEEDVQGVTTIARMLSRHLEKLGVRFRSTRRTLRDPIQETIVLAQKTSEVVGALANRGEMLEKELQETQQVLVAMQAQQAQQLELLVAGMTKTLRSQRASEARILKGLAGQMSAAPGSSIENGSSMPILKPKGGSPPKRRKQNLMMDIGRLWKERLMANDETNISSSSLSGKVSATEVGQVKKQHAVDKENGHAAKVADSVNSPREESMYSPDTSFKNEDFWATTTGPPRETSSDTSSPETQRTTDFRPQSTAKPQDRSSFGKLDSFFNSRKGVSSS